MTDTASAKSNADAAMNFLRLAVPFFAVDRESIEGDDMSTARDHLGCAMAHLSQALTDLSGDVLTPNE